MADRLDNWQERMQSEVVTYNLDKPMILTEFLQLPEHAQKEYLTKLRRVHGGKIEQIANMFACSEELVRGLYKKLDVGLRMGRFGAAQAADWEKFTKGMPAAEEQVRAAASPLDGFRVYEKAGKAEKAPDSAGSIIPSGMIDPYGKAGETDSSAAACACAQNDGTGDPPPTARYSGTGDPPPTARYGGTGEKDSSGSPAVEMTEDGHGGRTLCAPTARVKTRLRSFRVELCGPMDEILQRMRDFAGVVDGIKVLVIVSVDEEEDVE